MIQNATWESKKSAKTAGRPVEFDRDAVIDGAVELFWTNGFDDTSLDDLVAGLGVSRSTLYNSFGGKDGLYDAVLDRYLDRVEHVVVQPLRSGADGIVDLVAFTTRLNDVLTSPAMPAGCLVLNSIASPRNAPAVSRYLASLRTGISAALTRAARLGEIDETTIDTRTALVLSAVIGLNHVAHASVDIDIDELTDALRSTIQNWQTI